MQFKIKPIHSPKHSFPASLTELELYNTKLAKKLKQVERKKQVQHIG